MDIELLDVDEMAKALKVKSSWIYGETRKKGEDTIPVLRVGKYLRFNKAKVIAWLEERQNKET